MFTKLLRADVIKMSKNNVSVILIAIFLMFGIFGSYLKDVYVTASRSNININISTDKYIKTNNKYHKLVDDNYMHNYEMLSRTPTTYSIEAMQEYLSTDETHYVSVVNDICCLSDEIVMNCESDYDKLLALTKWMGYNIYYDKDAAESGITAETISIEKVLKDRRATCAGYANLFGYLCAAQGFDVVSFRGGVPRGEDYPYEEIENAPLNHEWVGVYIDNTIMLIDPTWMSSNYYQDGKKYSAKRLNYDYFNMSLDLFSIEHRIILSENRRFKDIIALYREV